MKSKIPCNVIKDLMPLYLDELTSEETSKEVELHVSECEECNRSLQIMKDPDKIFDEDEEKEIKFLKKNKKRNLMVVITAAMMCIVLVSLASIGFGQIAAAKFDFATFAVEAKPGDTFFFGEYEQDGNLDNGPEPIEWIVMRNKDNTLYVMSKYGLDHKPYHDKKETVTWETCSLRQWLNNDFYDEAFSSMEKDMIMETKLNNYNNPYYDTKGGNSTTDKVFLLSYSEFEPNSFPYKLCSSTSYAESKGVVITKEVAIQCSWWLRTPGIHDKAATFANYYVGGQSIGNSVNIDGLAVRPCINIKYQ